MKMIHLFTLSFVTIATFYMYNVAAECYAFFGPDGSKECKKLSGYNDTQWVTCASDSYVRERSNDKYHCRVGSYCTFNCMVELYDKRSGDVKGICQCSPGDTPPRTLPTAAIIREKMLQCSPYSGPGGRRECIKESGYNDYQWVTCASDSYVRERSNGNYQCLDESYCTFSCMVELYDKRSGDVKGICQCSPGDTPPRTLPTAAIIREKMLQCSADSGPGGHKECIKESGYNDYQWVTCASDFYVRVKSSDSFNCKYRSYCKFTCMTEVYHRSSGDVKGICQCSPGDIPPKAFGSAASHTIMNVLLCGVPLIASFTLISL